MSSEVSSPGNLPAEPLQSVFVSYAHADDDDRDVSKRWVHRLRVHLAPLVRRNEVCIWSDKDILIGEDWHAKIQGALRGAKAAVVLVGPEFLASEYVANYELPILLDMAHKGGLTILPIVVRPSLLEETFFKYPDPRDGPEEVSLASFHLANPPNRPLNSMRENEQDDVFVSVARRVLQLVRPEGGSTPSDTPQTPPVPQAPQAQVNAVNDAFGLLSTLIKNTPEVRDAVHRFRKDFRAASDQIDLMSAYKDLHDLLHTLQFQCCDLIAAELSHFPEDEGSHDRLMEPEMRLRETVDSIREQEERWKQTEIDTGRLLVALESALQQLQATLQDHSSAGLRRACSNMTGILNRYPALINMFLLKVARGLRLPSLIRAMSDIWNRLAGLNIRGEQSEQFVAGVAALTRINERLSELLYEHDQWQAADEEMRLIQINSEDFLDDLHNAWPRLSVLTKVLYYQNPKPWAQQFMSDSEGLEKALAGSNPSVMKNSYRSFRRRAGMRFFQVDVELKRLCDDLRRVAEPIDRVLRMLGDDVGGGADNERDE